MSTTTYAYPVAGAVAPTRAQALDCNKVTASVQFADADTVATVVHNFKLSAAQLADQFPIVTVTIGTAGTLAVNYAVALTDSSTVTITKASTAAGSGSTLLVTVDRPFSKSA